MKSKTLAARRPCEGARSNAGKYREFLFLSRRGCCLLQPSSMQNGFFQKVVICAVIGAFAAGMVEFYRTFVDGADRALNGNHQKMVHMHRPPSK